MTVAGPSNQPVLRRRDYEDRPMSIAAMSVIDCRTQSLDVELAEVSW